MIVHLTKRQYNLSPPDIYNNMHSAISDIVLLLGLYEIRLCSEFFSGKSISVRLLIYCERDLTTTLISVATIEQIFHLFFYTTNVNVVHFDHILITDTKLSQPT